MALMGEDIFVDNILDDPNELERVEEGEVLNELETEDANENNDENESENKKPDESGTSERKRRRINQKPKLNILRLMSDKYGLTTIKSVFNDVKLKGKGREREDLNLIMRKLEIWAHQLYPSMQFDDCLARLEKLGKSKPVMTYVSKIRMGLEDEVPRGDEVINDPDDSDSEMQPQPQSSISDFDRLLNSQNVQNVAPTNNSLGSLGLTAEQRERMMRNRLIAEQRRLARIQARQEQEQQSTEAGADVTGVEPPASWANEKETNVSQVNDVGSVVHSTSVSNDTENGNGSETHESNEEDTNLPIGNCIQEQPRVTAGVKPCNEVAHQSETEMCEEINDVSNSNEITDPTMNCIKDNSNTMEIIDEQIHEDREKVEDLDCGNSPILSK